MAKNNSLMNVLEVVMATSDKADSVRKTEMIKAGTLRKIAPKVYTTNMDDEPEVIVKRNLFYILGQLYPHAVISHRSAFELKPTMNGDIFLTYKYTKNITLPGITVHLMEGPTGTDHDMPFIENLYISSAERRMLENLQKGRARGGDSKCLPRTKIEENLECMLQVNGESGINAFRDKARQTSEEIGMQQEFEVLNNIIGAVAFYSWDGKKTDIVRFNEQFYEAVHVQEFAERLEFIEQFIHPDDWVKMHDAFRFAMMDKLNGHSETLRFYTPDGTVLSFYIHFYYLGKKEGGERFYGAAQNVTELTDLKEEVNLIANYSKDSLIFLRKVSNIWYYSVASRGLADLFDITPAEFEKELNEREFARKRVVNRKKYEEFMNAFHSFADKKRNFEGSLDVYDSSHHVVTLHLTFTCVSGQSNNIAYVLRASFIA